MMKRATSAAFAALSLAACGGPPSDDDFRAALRAQMEAMGGKAGAAMWKEEVDKSKLLGCSKSDAGGYRCDFNGPMGAGAGRFVKSDKGWVMIPGG